MGKSKRKLVYTPKQLRAIRTRLGLSVEQAASRCGVTARTWYAYEDGTRIPSPAVVMLIRQLSS